LAAEGDRHARRYAWVAVVASPIAGIIVPVVFRWLIALLAGA
jgi:glycerol uptake facilitator-like aquaporin